MMYVDAPCPRMIRPSCIPANKLPPGELSQIAGLPLPPSSARDNRSGEPAPIGPSRYTRAVFRNTPDSDRGTTVTVKVASSPEAGLVAIPIIRNTSAGRAPRIRLEAICASSCRRDEDNTAPKASLTSVRSPFMYEPGPSSREEARDDDHGDASSDRGHVCG